MNKNIVDELIPNAYKVLKKVGIADKDNQIERGFTGQISTFGASIMSGSVLASVAFFSDDKGSAVSRSKILRGIEELLNLNYNKGILEGTLFFYIRTQINEKNERKVKEELINCSIAMNLAMNLYTLVKTGGELIEP